MPSTQQAEFEKFDDMASDWWDPKGPMRPLHDINNLRSAYIDRQAGGVKGKRVLDVGCGAGLLSEALAARGAQVTGIDLASEVITVAKQHAQKSGLDIDYRITGSRDLASEAAGEYDIVVAYEMLEHVSEPRNIIQDCAMLADEKAHLFFSTINRSPLAWAAMIGGAEYILRLLPRGTHEYAKLIKPSELATHCRRAGLDILDITGMRYNPLTHSASLGHRPEINYFLHARKKGNE